MWEALTPEHFKDQWPVDEELRLDEDPILQIDYRPLVRVDESLVRPLPISSQDKRFLIEAGLPARAGVLSFRFSELAEEIEDLSEIAPLEVCQGINASSYLVLGRRGAYEGWDGKRVVIEAGTSNISIVDFPGEETVEFRRQFLNSGVAPLAFSILTYKRLFIMPSYDHSLFEGFDDPKSFRKHSANLFFRTISEFDPQAFVSREAFWPSILKEEFGFEL